MDFWQYAAGRKLSTISVDNSVQNSAQAREFIGFGSGWFQAMHLDWPVFSLFINGLEPVLKADFNQLQGLLQIRPLPEFLRACGQVQPGKPYDD